MGSESRPDDSGLDTLSALQSLLLSTPDVEEFLAEVTRLASRAVEAPTSCGITTASERGPRTVATSDDRAALVDEEQYTEGEGPCLEALRVGKFIEVEDQALDDRWPAYRDHALQLGVRCSISFPLVVQDETVGALNVYGFEQPGIFTEEDRQRTATFAAQAATALAVAMRFAKQAEVSQQLEEALSSRTVIDQAIGVLMGQQRCDAETAFSLLRTHSQNNNLKLRDVASDLITRLTGQPPTEGRGFAR